MTDNDTELSVFEQIRGGVEDSIAFSRGKLSLATTELPAPPPRVSARHVQALRARLDMSQAVFAAVLNVSKKTVQSWEQRLRRPGEAALRMLQVLQVQPSLVPWIFSMKGRAAPRVAFRRAGRKSVGAKRSAKKAVKTRRTRRTRRGSQRIHA